MAINFVKMFDPEAQQDPTSDYKQKVALARALSQAGGSGDPVYSRGAGLARVAQGVMGGLLERKATDDENKANADAGSLIAKALMGWGGGGSSAATPSADASAPAGGAAPSLASADGSGRTMTMPLAGDENERAKTVFDGLVQRGLSPVAAAGIAGNFHGESGFDPTIAGDHGTSFGLAQWRGDRLDALKQLAASQGKDWRDTNVQLDHVMNELKGPEAQAYAALQGAKSPEEAATQFMQKYERPAAWAMSQSGPGRASMAAQIFNQFGNAPAVANSGQPAPVGPAQVASLDPSVGVSGGAPAPVGAPQAAQPAPSAPVQVAQAGPSANPLATALQQPPAMPSAAMNPQQQEIVRQLLGNPRTRQAGMVLLQQHQEQAEAAQKAQRDIAIKQWEMQQNQGFQRSQQQNSQEFQRQQGETQRQFEERMKREGWNREDANKAAEWDHQDKTPTGDIKEYNLAVQQAQQSGQPVPDFTTWSRGNKEAGRPTTNIDMKSEGAEAQERGKGLATRFNKMADDGDAAAQELMTIKRMNSLGNNVDPGSRTAFMEDLRKNFGIQLDPKADDVTAFKAVVEYMKPRMKVTGAGGNSDKDMDSFGDAIMQLRGTQGGNEIIANTLGGMAQWRMMRGDIAQRYQVGEINAKQAMDEIKALPDPFDSFKQWQKQNPNAPKGNPAATVQDPNGGLKAEPAPKGYPADAKQAPDGNWYVPDKDRPGKYLRVQ